MAKKRIFISFDFDNDVDLRGNLVHQSKLPDSPFSIIDCSVKAPYDEKWRQRVRRIIRREHLTIVICGEHTRKVPTGVAAELTISREVGTRYVLLRGRRRRPCSKPAMAHRSDTMHNWTWKNLHKLIHAPE